MVPLLDGITLQEYAQHDDDVVTSRDDMSGPDWEHQLVDKAKTGFAESDYSDDEQPPTSLDDLEKQEPRAVSTQEAARMVEKLRRFGLENSKPQIIEAMLKIEGTIQQMKFERIKRSKQSTLTNFFPLK